MQLGPLFIGWVLLSESDRIALGLASWAQGWHGLCVEWNGRGICLLARPR